MSARPIIPGRLYRVCHAGRTFAVLAEHGCDAICVALNAIEEEK
jgi:hypothetical protein